ncbi:hypothetical protein EX30DRAFT_320428 [Ascodesmis nigricans]|uniref:BTB domain transcription factor n=1 Tax=Ascodesmis nigricans TaxID=341454 RepID=A0A4S2MUF1_9PEZI|nr:hypothetical protein EX30DRAFT_320428 [Ascodesmis nigricans]
MVTTRSSRGKTGADAESPSAGDKHAADVSSPHKSPAKKKTKTESKKRTKEETETVTADNEVDTTSATNTEETTSKPQKSHAANAAKNATVEDVTDSEEGGSGKFKKQQKQQKEEEERPAKRQKTASPGLNAEETTTGSGGKGEEKTKEPANEEKKPEVTESAKDRAQAAESSPILEKGIVYFFLRGKVDVENPENLNEVKRSYMVLRPIPMEKAIPAEDGKPVKDEGKARLIVIPKKRLPVRGYEKFLTFVEEPGAPVKEIGEKWLKGRTYSTKIIGDRTDYPAHPIGEGVYAITKADNERQSHFAYMLTVPEELGEIQDGFGLKHKGSFVVSVRNPENPAPANAAVPDPAEYSKEIMGEFGGLKWGPLQPKHLDYKNSEILFIGEKQFPEEGEHEGTEQELSKLEYEDEARVKHLNDTDSVFADLEKNKKELGEFTTNWGE